MDNKVKVPGGAFYVGDGLTVDPVTRTVSAGGGGSGASSSDVFIIHATPDETDTNVQLDKTTEQIYEAYQSGKYCLFYYNGKFVPVVSVETDGARAFMACYGFIFTTSFQGRVIGISLETNDGVTWATRNNPPILYDVRFNGLQIYGTGGRVYTISVDANGNISATEVTA